jgi:hypothetical protein
MLKRFFNQKNQIKNLFLFCLITLFSCAPPKSKITRNETNLKNSLEFSGYEWNIKNTTKRVGPGNNFFSSSTENVWVNSQGQLNLRISKRNEKWYCAEIISKQHFGYGYYEFLVTSKLDKLDKNVVLGLFTYDNKQKPHYNEIDIEFSKWGKENKTDAQYVIHKNQDEFNSFKFQVENNLIKSTHIFLRNKDSIYFASYKGHLKNALYNNKPYQEWSYKNDFRPSPANEKIHINLWLFRATPLMEKKEEIVIIEKFEFIPIKMHTKVSEN